MCSLDGGSDRKGLALHIGESDCLSLTGVDGNKRKLTALEPDRWYHLAVTLSGDEAVISLNDPTRCFIDQHEVRYKTPPFSTKEKFLKPDFYSRLAFFSAGPDDRAGGWSLDNVCMAGKVDACLLYTSPSPRDRQKSRMPSSA